MPFSQPEPGLGPLPHPARVPRSRIAGRNSWLPAGCSFPRCFSPQLFLAQEGSVLTMPMAAFVAARLWGACP